MDRSVTKKILYGPQKLRSIYYFFDEGPVHILPYDPQFHELFAIYFKLSYSVAVFYMSTKIVGVSISLTILLFFSSAKSWFACFSFRFL